MPHLTESNGQHILLDKVADFVKAKNEVKVIRELGSRLDLVVDTDVSGSGLVNRVHVQLEHLGEAGPHNHIDLIKEEIQHRNLVL